MSTIGKRLIISKYQRHFALKRVNAEGMLIQGLESISVKWILYTGPWLLAAGGWVVSNVEHGESSIQKPASSIAQSWQGFATRQCIQYRKPCPLGQDSLLDCDIGCQNEVSIAGRNGKPVR